MSDRPDATDPNTAGILFKHHVDEEQDNRKGATPPDLATAEEDDMDDKPSQKDLAQKAMTLKSKGEQAPNPMIEDGAALPPTDPDASDGKANLADTGERTNPSGALDHAGALPARKRSMNRR